MPVYLTIHNATYQGITPLRDGGYSTLDYINLPGTKLFHNLFDFFNNLNLLKSLHAQGARDWRQDHHGER